MLQKSLEQEQAHGTELMEVIFIKTACIIPSVYGYHPMKLREVEQVVSGHMYDIEGGPESRSANLNSFALDPRGQGSSPSDCRGTLSLKEKGVTDIADGLI